MKQLRYTFLFLLLLSGSMAALAAPGDTSVITTSPLLNADNSTSYDTTLVLPTQTYRKIYLVYTLTSHDCPAGSTYCHQWDYIGNVTLKSPLGDTIELDRIITPFATSGWSRFPNPPIWSEDYVFDVTDFAPLLQGAITINSALGVGSPGYSIYTKFIFIQGTPDRTTVGITPLYHHGGTYGSATNPIDNNFPVLSETAPEGTASAAFRFILSGHGSDTFGCCEFAEHYYNLYLNSDSIFQQSIWRRCGMGELYPQGGTWLADRSNWCPGASVLPYYDSLPGVVAGANYTVNVGFEPYVVNHPSGNYDASASVVYFGGMNKTIDASIEDIIAPTNSPAHFRENPSNNIPTIHLHNGGSTTLDSVAFLYGVADSTLQTYVWYGTLSPLTDTNIALPAAATIANLSASNQTGTFPFIVAITGVNGAPDVDQTNDTMRSQFIVAPDWPDTIIVKMLSSNLGADGESLDADPADANWYILDIFGDTIVSLTNTNYSTLYIDTVTLPYNGYYQIVVSTPAFCSGLHWWYYDDVVTGYAPGFLQVKKLTGSNLAMHGYTYAVNTTTGGLKNFGEHDDFGCGYSQFFYVSTTATSEVHNVLSAPAIDVYPNPANEEINLSFQNVDTKGATISIINILGQSVFTAAVTGDYMTINSSSFVPGVYSVMMNTGSGSNSIGQVIIAH